MASDPQCWDLDAPGDSGAVTYHRVTVTPDGWSRRTTWTVNDLVVAEKKSGEDRLVLADPVYGAVRVVFSALGTPRRVTWFEGDAAGITAHTGIGGIDLDPERGSKAALRDEQMRAHPNRYAARHVLSGVAKVVVPLVLAYLAARLAVRIPWPDWDLPSLPRPDLPDLMPDFSLPDWDLSVPGCLAWLLDKVKYVLPVLIGITLARNEVVRRRKQDRIKEEWGTRARGRVDSDDADSA